jgi:DNA-binding ferritin-like protein
MSHFLAEKSITSKMKLLGFTVRRRFEEFSKSFEEILKMKAAKFDVEINDLLHSRSTNFAKHLWQLNFLFE